MAKVIKLKTTKPGFSATPSTSSKRSASGGQFRGGYKKGKFVKDKRHEQHDKASYSKPDNRSQDNKSRGNGSSGSKDKKDSKGETFLSMLNTGQFSSEAIEAVHEAGLNVDMAVTAAGFIQPGRISKCPAA